MDAADPPVLRYAYRSLAGEVYYAEVRARRPDGTFDIEVTIPGTATTISLTKIKRGTAPGELLEGT